MIFVLYSHISKYAYIHIYIHMQHHNDTQINTSKDFFRKICTSHFIVRVWKGLLRVLLWEGVGGRTELQYIEPHSYGRQRCVFLILLMLNWRPGCSAFCWVLVFSTTSCHKRVSKSTGGPEGPFGRVWLSLPHIITNVSDPQLSDFLSWQSYIIVQRPLNRPLNLGNGMFNRHQVEITVMQFTGHSLPVHQSMSVLWDFYLVPFHQPNPPMRSLSITGHWNVSLPSGASLWNGMFGWVEGQNTTFVAATTSLLYSKVHNLFIMKNCAIGKYLLSSPYTNHRKTTWIQKTTIQLY